MDEAHRVFDDSVVPLPVIGLLGLVVTVAWLLGAVLSRAEN
jgi:hypothetical protein